MLVGPARGIDLSADRPPSEAAAAGSMRQQFGPDVSRTSETPENVKFHTGARIGRDVIADESSARGGNY
jgi:hypothetical protein